MPSSQGQALHGYLITAPPSVCVPAVLGELSVWIQNQKEKEQGFVSTTRTYHDTYENHWFRVQGLLRECRSNQSCVSRFPYYCTPPATIPDVIGGLAAWRDNTHKKKTTRKRDWAPKLEPIEWISSPSLARALKLGGSAQMNVMNVNGSGRVTSRRIDPCQNLADSQYIWRTTLPDIQDRFQTCPKRYWNPFFLEGKKDNLPHRKSRMHQYFTVTFLTNFQIIGFKPESPSWSISIWWIKKFTTRPVSEDSRILFGG